MQTVIETITPAKAKEYLKTTQGNRPISKVTVRSYADSMLQGKWLLNGVAIIFDNEGHLIDGHHRLNAIVKADVPVQTCVCRGAEPDSFKTIDQGRGRNLGQLIAMQQVLNYNAVASIVNANNSLIISGRFWVNNGARSKQATNADLYDEYYRNKEEYQEAGTYACEMYRQARIIKASWIGALYYYLSHTGCYKKDYVKRFFTAVCSLETSGISAADELRNFIIRNDRNRTDGAKLDQERLFAIICKAWNAYVAGKEVKKYKFDPDNEDYPTLKLNTED